MEISAIDRVLSLAGLTDVRRIAPASPSAARDTARASGRLERRGRETDEGVRVELSKEAVERSREPSRSAPRSQAGSRRAVPGASGEGSDAPAAAAGIDPSALHEVRQLARRDREVRAHEAAHKAAAGGLARGGTSFETVRGPDGRDYAVGGEVQIDTAPVANDPEATIQKMQQVRRAATAPAQPSSQDRKVAAEASASERKARSELRKERAEERDASPAAPAQAPGADRAATDASPRRSRIDRAFGVSQPDRRGRSLDLIA